MPILENFVLGFEAEKFGNLTYVELRTGTYEHEHFPLEPFLKELSRFEDTLKFAWIHVNHGGPLEFANKLLYDQGIPYRTVLLTEEIVNGKLRYSYRFRRHER